MRQISKHLIGITCISLSVVACKPKQAENQQQNNTTADTNEVENIQIPTRQDLTEEDSIETSAYYKVLETGLKYHMHEYHPNRPYPNPGDVIYLKMEYFLGDSLLFSSTELPDTMKMRMQKPELPGTIDEALFQMHERDSAEFLLDAVKFYRHTRQLAETPHFIFPGDSLRFHIRMMKIIPAERWEIMQNAKLHEKRQLEASEIKRYMLKHEINATNLSSGVYREITHQGSGPAINENSQVSIHYEGKFLDDKVFSTTLTSQEVFTFKLGNQEVIPGLEHGLTGMTQGSTGVIIIPFDLAYGEEQKGPVPPWSTLVFSVQILSVQ